MLLLDLVERLDAVFQYVQDGEFNSLSILASSIMNLW